MKGEITGGERQAFLFQSASSSERRSLPGTFGISGQSPRVPGDAAFEQ